MVYETRNFHVGSKTINTIKSKMKTSRNHESLKQVLTEVFRAKTLAKQRKSSEEDMNH
jgi:hypothetical protein